MVQDGDQMAIYDKYNIEDVKVSDLKSFNDELSWRKDGHNVVFKDDATFASINVKEEPQDFAIPMPSFGGNHVAFKIHESKGSKNLKNTKDPRDLVTSVPSFGGNHMAFNKHRESKAAKNLKTSKEPPDLVVTEPLNGDNKFLKKQKRGKPSKDLKNKAWCKAFIHLEPGNPCAYMNGGSPCCPYYWDCQLLEPSSTLTLPRTTTPCTNI
eukprot:Gb_21423 [translate_table: standard]